MNREAPGVPQFDCGSRLSVSYSRLAFGKGKITMDDPRIITATFDQAEADEQILTYTVSDDAQKRRKVTSFQ